MSIRSARRASPPALVLAAVLAASLPAAVDAATVTVRLGDTLNPKTLTVDSGTTVRWVNESADRHRMRSRAGPVEFDSGNIEPGGSYAFAFSIPGTYPYLDVVIFTLFSLLSGLLCQVVWRLCWKDHGNEET